jgi:hypothetical protein
MPINILLFLFVMIQIKHFLLDYVLPNPFLEEDNTFGLLGGIIHSGFHAIVTFFILSSFGFQSMWLIYLMLIEFIWHYTQDWLKMYIVNVRKWGQESYENGVLVGFEQLSHQMNYCFILWIVYTHWSVCKSITSIGTT